MKLIVGLGNVGESYTQTRHNLGFMVIDQLVVDTALPACIDNAKFQAAIVEGRVGETKVLLTKPHTMMNLSGQAVAKLAHFYKLTAAEVWVVHDDLDLSFGQLRVRQGGGTAGHNGLKSIVAALGEGFGRFRIGIGNSSLKNPIPADAFVLSRFDGTEQPLLPQIVNQTAKIIVEQLAAGILEDMTYSLITKE